MERCESILKELEKRESHLNKVLTERLVDEGTTSISLVVDGKKVTAYRQKQRWCKRLPTSSAEDVYDALKRCGWDEYAIRNYNSNSVSAKFRELDTQGEEIPELLKEHLTFSDVERVNFRGL
jgi:hypothetical protein